MKSPTLIPYQSHRGYAFIQETGHPVRFDIIGFRVDTDEIEPLTWPKVPIGAKTFIEEAGGFRCIDLTTGVVSGPALNLPKWEA